MLEINLLPVREARRREDVRQQSLGLMLVLLVVGAVTGFTHHKVTSDIDVANARIHQMQRDIDQFKPQLEQVAQFRKRKAQLEKKIDVIDELDRARSGPVRVLDALANRTPDRLWITSLDTQGKTIMLKGASLDNELVALFLRGLDESPYFTEVDIDSTKLGTGKGLKVVTFEIRAVLENPKPAEAGAKAPEPA